VTGKWPPYFPNHPDNGLPTLDIGKGSPTAVMFGTDTKFPADYRRALFILDWAYGRILAVHLAPRGAGYRAQAETFLKGRPLNVTDLATGPDGAMYVVTGGRKTQSALYRIAYTGNDLADGAPSPHEITCQKYAEPASKLRLSLESESGARESPELAAVWPQLDAADPLIRHAARIAVERQPVKAWRELVLAEARPAALAGLMALVRSGDKAAIPAIVERQLGFTANDLDVEQTLILVQTYSLCLQLSPDAVMAKKDQIVAQLDPLFRHPAAQWPHVSPSGNGAALGRDLTRLLVQLGWPSAVDTISQSLLVSSAQEDRLHALFLLRNVRTGWTAPTRRAYFTALREGDSFLGGEGMPKFLAQIRADALATLSERERRDVADLLAPTVNSAENELPPPARSVVKQWTLDDFLPLLANSSRPGDAARGATVFRDALCVRCHRAGLRGPAIGPDLTHVTGRFSRRDILESILTPSKVVAENYRNIQVLAIDGRVIVGRVLAEGDYRSEKLRIATDPLRPAAVVELSKREIDQVRESESSPMPQGLLDSFGQAEVLDLLAFLLAGANVEPPAAGKRLP
jgi:putative heme-binding domain-containing protein